jgi:hypothetical protein
MEYSHAFIPMDDAAKNPRSGARDLAQVLSAPLSINWMSRLISLTAAQILIQYWNGIVKEIKRDIQFIR